MNPVPITQIVFDGRLETWEIPLFRGAVMAVAGNNPLYHNHAPDAQDIRRYPPVQYKRLDGHPVAVGVGEGAESLKNLFVLGSRHVLKIGRFYRDFVVADVVLDAFAPSLKGGEPQRYQIVSWLAFNSDNYKEYTQTSSLTARMAMLDAILTANILSLYKGLGVFVKDTVTAHVVDLAPLAVTFKGVRMIAFDAVIETNFALPLSCGLGKGVSHGFGTITRV